MKTNSQNRSERISIREKYIRKTSKGVINWSSDYVYLLTKMFKIQLLSYNELQEEIYLQTSFGKWKIVHDKKVVYLHHKSNVVRGGEKSRSEFHKQDVFYTLKQAFEYVIDHEEYIKHKN